MRKVCSILLVLAMLLSMLALPAYAEEKIVLTIAIPDNVKVEDYNTNEMTLQLEELLGYDLQFTVIPSTDYRDKINLMVQSGDKLPDIIICSGFSTDLIYSWALEGALAPMTEYYEDAELAANIQNIYNEVGDFRSMIILPDGEIYQIPSYPRSNINEQCSRLFLNTPLLNELGLETPTTTDELLDVLRKLKASSPDMVGVAGADGIYGMPSKNSWFDYFMNAFVYSDGVNNFMKIDDGVLSFAYTTEEWKEGLKYIKQLFDEGLIAKESLTQNTEQYTSLINSCEVIGISNISPMHFTDERKDTFTVIEPVAGPNGLRVARYNPSVPSNGMLITADCEHPEAAFKLGDTLVNRHWTVTNRWGQQGRDWDWWEDYQKTIENYNEADWSATNPTAEKLIYVYDDASFWGSGTMQNRAWMSIGPAIRGANVADGRVINANNVAPYTLNQAVGGMMYPPFYPDEYISTLIYTAEEGEVMSEVLTNLQTYVSLTTSNWLLGNGDIDAEWDAFQAEIVKIGIEQAREIAQAAYDRSIGK
ncbi:MAG: extracellular solute-binding protein [Clostridia bacterium]|nr:extracellular solute-binding protein [Clostridia bacterium]